MSKKRSDGPYLPSAEPATSDHPPFVSAANDDPRDAPADRHTMAPATWLCDVCGESIEPNEKWAPTATGQRHSSCVGTIASPPGGTPAHPVVLSCREVPMGNDPVPCLERPARKKGPRKARSVIDTVRYAERLFNRFPLAKRKIMAEMLLASVTEENQP